MSILTVLIADDQLLFAENLKIVLETLTNDILVVGIAKDGNEAVQMTQQLQPDLVLTDVSMPGKNGVEATMAILAANPSQKVVMLTSMQDEIYASQSLNEGAVGYLLKDMRSSNLISSLRAINDGMVLLSNTTAQSVFHMNQSRHREDPQTIARYQEIFDSLGKREIEILGLMIQGRTNAEIARECYLSEPTVRNYISSIYSKFQTNQRMEVIRHGEKILSLFSGDSGPSTTN